MMESFDLPKDQQHDVSARPKVPPPTEKDSPYHFEEVADGEVVDQSSNMARSLVYHDPGNYEGEMKDNQRCGNGKCVWSDGS